MSGCVSDSGSEEPKTHRQKPHRGAPSTIQGREQTPTSLKQGSGREGTGKTNPRGTDGGSRPKDRRSNTGGEARRATEPHSAPTGQKDFYDVHPAISKEATPSFSITGITTRS